MIGINFQGVPSWELFFYQNRVNPLFLGKKKWFCKKTIFCIPRICPFLVRNWRFTNTFPAGNFVFFVKKWVAFVCNWNYAFLIFFLKNLFVEIFGKAIYEFCFGILSVFNVNITSVNAFVEIYIESSA